MQKIKIGICVAVALITHSVTIYAACAPIPFGWYVEGNVGASRTTNTNFGARGDISSAGLGFNGNVGYKFMPYFAVEAGYSKYAEARIKNAAGKEIGKAQHFSYDVAAKGILPIVDTGFELFAKLGAAHVNSDVSSNNQFRPFVDRLSKGTHTANSFYIGVGGDYSITPNIPINIQWQRANGNNQTGRLDLYSIGIGYILA